MDSFIVLVTGGRDYTRSDELSDVLDAIHANHKITLLVHGGARGADMLADAWARKNMVPRVECPADWGRYGRIAGPIRNREMLVRWKPDMVIVFEGGKGTADMERAATEAGVEICKQLKKQELC